MYLNEKDKKGDQILLDPPTACNEEGKKQLITIDNVTKSESIVFLLLIVPFFFDKHSGIIFIFQLDYFYLPKHYDGIILLCLFLIYLIAINAQLL